MHSDEQQNKTLQNEHCKSEVIWTSLGHYNHIKFPANKNKFLEFSTQANLP